jgi:aquaporin Z
VIAICSYTGSLFVKCAIGFNANLGANAPNYSFSIPIVFGIEVLASALLMAVIFVVLYTKGLRGFGGIAIGGIVGLDIFFLAFISGASMNPARSLALAFRCIRKSMALLVCYFCWNINCCVYHQRKICQE